MQATSSCCGHRENEFRILPPPGIQYVQSTRPSFQLFPRRIDGLRALQTCSMSHSQDMWREAASAAIPMLQLSAQKRVQELAAADGQNKFMRTSICDLRQRWHGRACRTVVLQTRAVFPSDITVSLSSSAKRGQAAIRVCTIGDTEAATKLGQTV